MRRAALAFALAVFGIPAYGAPAVACTTPKETDADAATAVVQHTYNVADFDAAMCQEGQYILMEWKGADGHGAGQALLRKSGSGWVLVKKTTASLHVVQLLESLGVPSATAKALADDP